MVSPIEQLKEWFLGNPTINKMIYARGTRTEVEGVVSVDPEQTQIFCSNIEYYLGCWSKSGKPYKALLPDSLRIIGFYETNLVPNIKFPTLDTSDIIKYPSISHSPSQDAQEIFGKIASMFHPDLDSESYFCYVNISKKRNLKIRIVSLKDKQEYTLKVPLCK